MENLPWFLGVLAAVFHAVGYTIYNIQSKKGESKPNAVSWFIWAFMAILNVTSFSEVTSIPHALQYAVGTLAASTTFLLALYWRRFDWPKPLEWSVLVFCLLSMYVWHHFGDASLANMTILVPFLISFYPTFKGVLDDPLREKPVAWNIWTLAFSTNLLNNALSWNGKWVSVANPIILLLCHGSIVYLSREARRKRVAVA